MAEYLYIHIPFCRNKCLYCDFLSVPYEKRFLENYVHALCKELFLRKRHAAPLKTIYIGGGTPSILSVEHFSTIFSTLRDNFHFSSFMEITVEANPETLNKTKVDSLLALGVNRLSIGVQSFDDAELKSLGRNHSAEEAQKTIQMIAGTGISNFSIDLMYAVPGQTSESWHRTLSIATDLSPTHISAYELTPEKNTPLCRLLKSKRISLPEELIVLEMYNDAVAFLSVHAYEQYEISNFARSGYRCVHNLNYWNRDEYLGFGAGAHSFVNDIRSKNSENINAYMKNLRKEMLPQAEVVKLTHTDALKEFVFLGLRKSEGVRISKGETLGLDLCTASQELIEEGYLAKDNTFLRLTRKGLPLSNRIILILFEKLGLE